jgi:uncharacterized membrane protein
MMGNGVDRPRSIELFEQLYLLAVVIDIARATIDWPLLMQASAPDRGVRLASIIVSLVLVLLVSRRRHRWAAVLLGALFMIGLPMVGRVLQTNVPIEASLIIVVQMLLQAVAVVCLVVPASRAWLGGPAGERPSA